MAIRIRTSWSIDEMIARQSSVQSTVINFILSNISEGINTQKIRSGFIKVTEFISSENYVAGTSGWIIDGNGDAEFNNVVVRGQIEATSGSLANLTISGLLTMGASGKIRTAASGHRIEIGAAAGLEDTINMFGTSVTATIHVALASTLTIDSSANINIFAGAGSLALTGSQAVFSEPVTVPNLVCASMTGVDAISGVITMRSNEFYADNGSAGDPSYTFFSDQDTGMFTSAGAVVFTSNAVGIVSFLNGSIEFPGRGTTANSSLPAWRQNAASGTVLLALTSSRRYKTDIKDVNRAEWIKILEGLRPRTFKSKLANDDKRKRMLGIIAEEALEVAPQFVDVQDGQAEGFHYEALIPVFLVGMQDLLERVKRLEGATP